MKEHMDNWDTVLTLITFLLTYFMNSKRNFCYLATIYCKQLHKDKVVIVIA